MGNTKYIDVEIFKESGGYIAHAPDLDIATQGESVPQVKERFKERLSMVDNKLKPLYTLKK